MFYHFISVESYYQIRCIDAIFISINLCLCSRCSMQLKNLRVNNHPGTYNKQTLKTGYCEEPTRKSIHSLSHFAPVTNSLPNNEILVAMRSVSPIAVT